MRLMAVARRRVVLLLVASSESNRDKLVDRNEVGELMILVAG